jgi:predicted transcriptional regulator
MPIANATVSSFSPAAAAVLPVGLALTQPVVCVESSLPWAAVARTPMLCESPGSIPVVDHDCRLMFLLSKEWIALAGRVDQSNGHRTVSDRAAFGLAVYERASLGEAFAIMGRHRVRELIVVDDRGGVVGKLGDVEALHLVAYVARTGTRPPAHRAA